MTNLALEWKRITSIKRDELNEESFMKEKPFNVFSTTPKKKNEKKCLKIRNKENPNSKKVAGGFSCFFIYT